MGAQALEKVQEAARRVGEAQQQAFAAALNRQIDEKEHKVEQREDVVREDLDPDARRRQEEERRRSQGGRGEPEDPPDEDPERGRHVDARA